MEVERMFANLKVAAIASDPDFNIIYINKRGEELFKAVMNAENLVGTNMRDCHKPETNEKLENLFQEYREKKRNLDHYVMDVPGGKATIVNVPFYEGDKFTGVVEFIFEGPLG
ncbi:MAG TPA: PAS domain-containing protein [Geobacteraceae bacterium]|nr:PAS domain-containing protein [Geobacteraceae bacterium]